MKASMPSLSRPIELSMPAAVSIVRQGALPARGSCVIVLGRMPPRRRRSTSAFHLAGVAERARGDQDRIRQPQPAELDGEIDLRR